jgi:hypothetical protein
VKDDPWFAFISLGELIAGLVMTGAFALVVIYDQYKRRKRHGRNEFL